MLRRWTGRSGLSRSVCMLAGCLLPLRQIAALKALAVASRRCSIREMSARLWNGYKWEHRLGRVHCHSRGRERVLQSAGCYERHLRVRWAAIQPGQLSSLAEGGVRRSDCRAVRHGQRQPVGRFLGRRGFSPLQYVQGAHANFPITCGDAKGGNTVQAVGQVGCISKARR